MVFGFPDVLSLYEVVKRYCGKELNTWRQRVSGGTLSHETL